MSSNGREGATRGHVTARRVAVAVSAVAAASVFYVARNVFPYHSTNHDEGVYLQQASMLLDGRLNIWAPSPELTEAFRPWFFVVKGARMYPKYSPVPSSVFALGEAVGGYRLALAAVAFCNCLLVYAVVSEGFDKSVGAVSAAVVALSPFFLVNTALFLPYATTTLFNLVFALGYVRAFVGSDRGVDLRYACLAGLGVGVAFFSRPYTAVLFASPFIVHALYSLFQARGGDLRRYFVGYAVVSSFGVAFVSVTLGYNVLVTGSPLTFPYLEFAPRDGLGFGERAILGYERTYTPTLAVRANARALLRLATDWTTAGTLGSIIGVAGFVYAFLGTREREKKVRLLLTGVLVAFVVGNVYFWGTLNILGELDDPTDGLITLYGPYYHYDVLLPASAFVAYGLVSAYRGTKDRLPGGGSAPVCAAVAVVFAATFGAAAVAAVDDKVERNTEITDVYEEAYEPFEGKGFDDAVVFLPTPYGDWLNHPFQYLRNGPDLSGDIVYALDGGPDNFDIIDEYPNRTYHRYSYRGEWEPYTGEGVEPKLEEVNVVEGKGVAVVTSVEADGASTVSVSLRSESGGDTVYHGVRANDTVVVETRVDSKGGDEGVAYFGTNPHKTVRVHDRVELVLTVNVVRDYLNEVSYTQRIPIGVRDGAVSSVSPKTEYCPSPTGCGESATYVGDGGVRTEIRSTSGAPG